MPPEIIPAPWGDNFIVTVGATYVTGITIIHIYFI